MTTAREILLDPMVRGRRVLELWPAAPDGDLPVSAQQAREWSVLAPEAPPLPIAEGDIDALVALSPWWLQGDSERRAAWLAEIDRVLSPDGALLLDVGLDGDDQEALLALLGQRFGWVAQLGEASFLGACFLLAETEDMAVAGDLGGLSAAATRRLVIAARQADPAWRLRESLLIPTPDPGQAQRMRALVAEGDELREQLMQLTEQNQELQQTLASLRRHSERQLGLLARSESAAELCILERDRAQQRAEAAERAAAEAEVGVRRQAMELAALQREREMERELAARGAPQKNRDRHLLSDP